MMHTHKRAYKLKGCGHGCSTQLSCLVRQLCSKSVPYLDVVVNDSYSVGNHGCGHRISGGLAADVLQPGGNCLHMSHPLLTVHKLLNAEAPVMLNRLDFAAIL